MRKILIILLVATLATSCGFKIVKETGPNNFDLGDITFKGNNRINYILNQNLSQIITNTNKQKMNLFIDSSKFKTIKEKNNKNEITKYLITIRLDIKVFGSTEKYKMIKLSDALDYNVNSQHSKTINDEKKTIKLITDKLSDRLLRELFLININDL